MEGKMSEGKHADRGDTSRVKVIEHENARDRPVSHFPKEVAQICTDICTYFHGINELTLPPGADQRALSKLPDCPSVQLDLLSAHDGGLWLLEYELLPCSEVERIRVDGRVFVSLARNIDGAMLICEPDDHYGAVYEFEPDDEQLGERLAPCLATFLERYRDQLLSKQVEYVDECGVIECSTSAGASASAVSSSIGNKK